jgi:hypothetical protein
MAKFKITKVYIVEAASKDEAFAIVKRTGSEFLEYIGIQQVPEPNKNSWTGALKNQLAGTK